MARIYREKVVWKSDLILKYCVLVLVASMHIGRRKRDMARLFIIFHSTFYMYISYKSLIYKSQILNLLADIYKVGSYPSHLKYFFCNTKEACHFAYLPREAFHRDEERNQISTLYDKFKFGISSKFIKFQTSINRHCARDDAKNLLVSKLIGFLDPRVQFLDFMENGFSQTASQHGEDFVLQFQSALNCKQNLHSF